MKKIVFKINSYAELWEVFDKNLNNIFIHKFMPSEAIRWWKTNLKTENGILFKDLAVRQMKMDVQTDLDGLKKILELNMNQLRIYQFTKQISDTLKVEGLSENNRNQILRENGLKHFFFINYEYLTIESFETAFLDSIIAKTKYKEGI